MRLTRLLAVPIVRKKIACEALTFVCSAAVLAALAYGADRLWPGSWLFAVLLLAMRVGQPLHRAAIMELRPRRLATLVERPEQAPLFWEIADELAAAADMKRPRLFIISPVSRAPAASWGHGDGAAIGAQAELLARFQRRWLKAIVAHEYAHIAMRDGLVGYCIAAFLLAIRAMALGLLGLGVVKAVMAMAAVTAFAVPWTALGVSAGATAALIAVDLAGQFWVPRLVFMREYAADALAVALTGDLRGYVAMLTAFALVNRDTRIDARPRPGVSHPPPIARIAALLGEALRTNKKR